MPPIGPRWKRPCAPRSRAPTAAQAIDEVLEKLGWLELLEAEPADAIDVVFSALGATNRTATALDDVVLSALGTKPRSDLAVVLPRFAAWDPPGRIDGEALHVRGLATARAATAREMLVVGGRASEPWGVTIPMAVAEVDAVRGIDPAAGFHAVCVQGKPAVATPIAPAAWQSAVALGRRAVAHQIAGASRAMLALARTHAIERVQFGRPIARFQAVRHRLADALVAVEALEASLARGQGRTEPRNGGAREGRRRTHRGHRGRTLPAGARRHRLHHGASVPPLPQADHRPRGALRIGRRDRAGRRTAAARHAPCSDAHRAVTTTACSATERAHW